MKDDKAKDATSVENAPRMTREETPVAAMAPVATVATATPKDDGKKAAPSKGSASKGSAKNGGAKKGGAKKAAAAARPAAKEAPRATTAKARADSKAKAAKPRAGKSAAKPKSTAKPKSAAAKSPARAKSSPAVASAPKAAARPAVAKAAVAKPPVTKSPIAKPPVAKPTVPAPAMEAQVADTARMTIDVARKALPVNPVQAAATALQAALRGPMPTGVVPSAQAALAPFSAALESGAEQARNAIGRARDTRESLQQAVAHSATAAAQGMLDVNGKVMELLRAQSDAAFELWRSALSAGSLSEAVRVQTSGMRQAYEATTTHAKDVAEAATRAIGDTVKPLQSAMARTPR